MGEAGNELKSEAEGANQCLIPWTGSDALCQSLHQRSQPRTLTRALRSMALVQRIRSAKIASICAIGLSDLARSIGNAIYAS